MKSERFYIIICLVLITIQWGCEKKKQAMPEPSKKTQVVKKDPPKNEQPSWTGTINKLAYTVDFKPIEKNGQWFYVLDLTIDVPENEPTLVLQLASDDTKIKAHPMRFEKKLIANKKELNTSAYAGYYNSKVHHLESGKKHKFSYNSTTSRRMKRVAPKAGQQLEMLVCLAGLHQPTNSDLYKICLTTINMVITKDNKAKVTLTPYNKGTTVKPLDPVLSENLGEQTLQITPYKKQWEPNMRRIVAYNGIPSLIYLPSTTWRKNSLLVIYRNNQLIVNDTLYTDYPEGTKFVIRNSVLQIDNKVIKSKKLTLDQLADYYPKKDQTDYFKMAKGDYYIDLQSSQGTGLGSNTKLKPNGKKLTTLTDYQGIEAKIDEGQFFYKDVNDKTFTKFGKVKKGSYIRTSLHKVWINNKLRKPIK